MGWIWVLWARGLASPGMVHEHGTHTSGRDLRVLPAFSAASSRGESSSAQQTGSATRGRSSLSLASFPIKEGCFPPTDMLIDFLERKEGVGGETDVREKLRSVAACTRPNQGSNL